MKKRTDPFRDSEISYQTIFENTGTATVLLEENTVISHANAEFVHLSGYPVEEIEGKKSWTEFVFQEDMDWMLAQHDLKRENPTAALRNYEFRFVRKSGEIRNIFLTIDIIPGTKRSVASLADITEHKRAEEALKVSEARLNSIVHGSPMLQFVIDKDHRVISWNKAIEEYSGIKSADIVGTRDLWKAFYESERPVLADLLVDEKIELLPEWYQGTITKSRFVDGAYEATDFFPKMGANGKWLYFTAAPIRDPAGNIIGAVETLEDITEHKRAEEALTESEEKYRRFFRTSRDSVFITSKDGHFIDFNMVLVKLFGYSDQELRQVKVEDLYANPEERVNHINIIAERGFTREFPVDMRRKDGSVIHTLITSVARYDEKGNVIGFQGTIRDITEHKKAEEALKESEARLNSVMHGSPMLQFVIDKNHRVFSWNKAIEEYSGIKAETVVGTTDTWRAFYESERPVLADLLVDEKIELLPEWYQGTITKSRFVDGAYEATDFFPKMGAKGKWLYFTAAPIRNTKGTIIGAVETLEDITERKQVEEALKESEARLNSIVHGSPMLQFVIDKNHRVFSWNRAIEEYSGIKSADIVDTRDQWKAFYNTERPVLADLLVDEKTELLSELYPGKFNKSRLVDGAYEATDFFPKMGTCGKWLYFTAAPIRDAAGIIIGAVETLEDITERKQAEDALLQANKKITLLNSITRHDILNQIMGLRAYLELSKEDITDSEILSYIAKEEQITQSIQEQIDFTRTYQDIGAQAPKWQILAEGIGTAIRQLNPPGVDIKADVDDVEIFADPIMEKVFYNLMENSLRHGEHVTRMEFSRKESGNGLIITYSDNGVGITAADKKKLFRKGFGKHTGLGLFLSREILSITGITITENGEPGKGVRFEILVPEGAYRQRAR
ncbi:MAG: PAS domain S-box protein [Methanoregula sp.]